MSIYSALLVLNIATATCYSLLAHVDMICLSSFSFSSAAGAGKGSLHSLRVARREWRGVERGEMRWVMRRVERREYDEHKPSVLLRTEEERAQTLHIPCR